MKAPITEMLHALGNTRGVQAFRCCRMHRLSYQRGCILTMPRSSKTHR